jgi:hypothetical protein
VRPKPRIQLAAALSCLGLLCTAPAATGGGPYDPCRQQPCKATLRIAADLTKWRSAETFYPRNEGLVTVLRVEGRKLRLDGVFGPGGCRSRYLGSGLMAIVKACDGVTPLRLRVTRLKGKRAKLVVHYQAVPAMRGDA